MKDSDKELLRLAVKAAGYKIVFTEDTDEPVRVDEMRDDDWNPLENNGQAFELAIDLKIGINHSGFTVFACDEFGDDLAAESVCSSVPRDKAARRAIVRAAAEIGKAMP